MRHSYQMLVTFVPVDVYEFLDNLLIPLRFSINLKGRLSVFSVHFVEYDTPKHLIGWWSFCQYQFALDEISQADCGANLTPFPEFQGSNKDDGNDLEQG